MPCVRQISSALCRCSSSLATPFHIRPPACMCVCLPRRPLPSPFLPESLPLTCLCLRQYLPFPDLPEVCLRVCAHTNTHTHVCVCVCVCFTRVCVCVCATPQRFLQQQGRQQSRADLNATQQASAARYDAGYGSNATGIGRALVTRRSVMSCRRKRKGGGGTGRGGGGRGVYRQD